MEIFLKEKEEIEKWLMVNGVKKFNLIPDDKFNWIVDVSQDVYFLNDSLTFIPVKFNHIKGSFYCNDNKLKTLSFAPQTVTGDFDCSENWLESLEGAPKMVGGNFICEGNKLKNLRFSPEKVNGMYACDDNELESLDGASEYIGGLLKCANNKIKTLIGCSKYIGGNLIIRGNNIEEIDFCPEYIGGNIYFSSNPVAEMLNQKINSGAIDFEILKIEHNKYLKKKLMEKLNNDLVVNSEDYFRNKI